MVITELPSLILPSVNTIPNKCETFYSSLINNLWEPENDVFYAGDTNRCIYHPDCKMEPKTNPVFLLGFDPQCAFVHEKYNWAYTVCNALLRISPSQNNEVEIKTNKKNQYVSH